MKYKKSTSVKETGYESEIAWSLDLGQVLKILAWVGFFALLLAGRIELLDLYFAFLRVIGMT